MFNYEATPIDVIKERFFCHPQLLETQNNSNEYVLIDEEKTHCFKVNRIVVKGSYVKKSNSFYIGIVTKGSGKVVIDGESYYVEFGTKFFVPYDTEAVKYESETNMDVLITFPPT